MRKKSIEKRHMLLCLAALFLVYGSGLYAAGVVIPGEVQDTLSSIQEAFTGDIARIIVGICFAGSCIAYAYNKDNEKMKAKMIAVMIATGLLAMSQTIVDSAMNMGT